MVSQNITTKAGKLRFSFMVCKYKKQTQKKILEKYKCFPDKLIKSLVSIIKVTPNYHVNVRIEVSIITSISRYILLQILKYKAELYEDMICKYMNRHKNGKI